MNYGILGLVLVGISLIGMSVMFLFCIGVYEIMDDYDDLAKEDLDGRSK